LNKIGTMYKQIKRILDVIFCIITIPFLFIIFVIVTVSIKLEDRGPVFYHSERIGKDCKKIIMLKFRSMKVGAPNILNEDGSTYNSASDPRVTKVGKILRDTSIDETPQLFNVIKGDMSIIGPRASGWDALTSYKGDELDKMKVRPGITGFTQAYYRNGLTVREKRLKDAWYANNESFGLDLRILLKTVITVISRKNVYTNLE
jgi:undecaprenyl phosphate N,N'-diacetylbacillosamine 1-phosphate transferase